MKRALIKYKLQMSFIVAVVLGSLWTLPIEPSQISSMYTQIRVPGDADTIEAALQQAQPGEMIVLRDASRISYPIELTQSDIHFVCGNGVGLHPPDDVFAISLQAVNVTISQCWVTNPHAKVLEIGSGIWGGRFVSGARHR